MIVEIKTMQGNCWKKGMDCEDINEWFDNNHARFVVVTLSSKHILIPYHNVAEIWKEKEKDQ